MFYIIRKPISNLLNKATSIKMTKTGLEIQQLIENAQNVITDRPALAESNVRVFVVAKNYQIIYQIDGEFVVVARILTRYQDVCFEL
jgi:hypothetical protein